MFSTPKQQNIVKILEKLLKSHKFANSVLHQNLWAVVYNIIILICFTIRKRVPCTVLPHSEAVHTQYIKSFVWNLFLVRISLSLNELSVVKQICNNKNVKFLPENRRLFDQLHSRPLGLTLAIALSYIVSFVSNCLVGGLGQPSLDQSQEISCETCGEEGSNEAGFPPNNSVSHSHFHYSTSIVQSSIIRAWNNRAIWDHIVRGICFTPFQINYVRSNLLGQILNILTWVFKCIS